MPTKNCFGNIFNNQFFSFFELFFKAPEINLNAIQSFYFIKMLAVLINGMRLPLNFGALSPDISP